MQERLLTMAAMIAVLFLAIRKAIQDRLARKFYIASVSAVLNGVRVKEPIQFVILRRTTPADHHFFLMAYTHYMRLGFKPKNIQLYITARRTVPLDARKSAV